MKIISKKLIFKLYPQYFIRTEDELR